MGEHMRWLWLFCVMWTMGCSGSAPAAGEPLSVPEMTVDIRPPVGPLPFGEPASLVIVISNNTLKSETFPAFNVPKSWMVAFQGVDGREWGCLATVVSRDADQEVKIGPGDARELTLELPGAHGGWTGIGTNRGAPLVALEAGQWVARVIYSPVLETEQTRHPRWGLRSEWILISVEGGG